MTLDEEISILVRQAYENESIEVKTSSVEKEDLVLDFDQDWQSYVNSLNLELNQDVYSYLEEGILLICYELKQQIYTTYILV